MNYGKKGVSDKQKELSSAGPKLAKKASYNFFKVLLVSVIAIAVLGICAGIGMVRGVIANSPDISNMQVSPTATASFVYDADGNEIQKLNLSTSNRIYVTIDQIPQYLQDAVVAIEDERFYQHNGIDFRGMVRAFVVNISNGDLSEGASTITQQLLKNSVFLNWTEESSVSEMFTRKFQEQYLALEYEKLVSKSEILENYLNTINLGSGTYGVQAAALRYFNKTVDQLTLSESTVIAGITQNPTWYDPIIYPEINQKRRIEVLNHMLDQDYISQEEYDEALADNVYDRILATAAKNGETSIYSYYIDEVIEQVTNDLQTKLGYTSTQAYKALYSGGLQIYTPQDIGIQTILDEEFTNPTNFPSTVQYYMEYALSIAKADGTQEHYSDEMLETYFIENESADFDLLFDSQEAGQAYAEAYKAVLIGEGDTVLAESIYFTAQPQASCTIIDQSTGYVVALVGGRGEKEASLVLNRATVTKRQPGSTFKILSTYAPALDTKGMTLATVYNNAPYAYSNGVEIKNWDSETNIYSGLTNIRSAIEDSTNIVAVKTLTDITPQLGYDYCLNFGITTLVESSDIIQPLALGGITEGVTNVELTAAYAAIANGGTYTKPIYYTKILDADGNVLLENEPETSTAIKETTAYLLTSAMEDVVKYGTGTGLSLGEMPVSGKTGTTDDSGDIWFSGFTPYYTCTVWGGFDNNVELPNYDIYQTYSKVLWKAVMSRIHENLKVKDFPVLDGIVTAVVCKKSGKLAVEGLCDHDPRGTQVYTEYFTSGTEPKVTCDAHAKKDICIVSGLLTNRYCTSKKSEVFIVLPEGSENTTDDTAYEAPTKTCTIHSKPVETEKAKETEAPGAPAESAGEATTP